MHDFEVILLLFWTRNSEILSSRKQSQDTLKSFRIQLRLNYYVVKIHRNNQKHCALYSNIDKGYYGNKGVKSLLVSLDDCYFPINKVLNKPSLKASNPCFKCVFPAKLFVKCESLKA